MQTAKQQIVKQLSVSMANKPGRLSAVLNALQKEKSPIRAFSVMDSTSRSSLRFVPDDPALAANALETIGIDFEEADVLLVEIQSGSAGLPKVCQRLAEGHLNVDYAYGSLSSPVGAKGGSLAVIKVNNLAKAQRLLSEGSNGAASRSKKKKPGRRPAYAR